MVSPPKANPHGAPGWYIHVSHLNLDRPRRLNWLKVSGLRSMFLLHDLIPITHPEYCRPEAFAQHWRRMETIAHQADVVIFNSKSTQNIWHSHLEQNGLPRPAGAVVPLGIDDTFLAGPNGPRIHSQIPYFVVVGNIERRKNLAFLLHVWKQWTQEGRRSRARLVVVGHRVWGSESIACLLDRSPALAPSIVEVMELTDYGLAALIRGAQALLAPSLIEGFGLPIAEALALGVPVIASDIAAHREVGGEFAEYINPVDGRGWIAALEEYVQPSSPRRTDLQARMQSYTATSWAKHMHEVETILSSR
jgi:glycosyltransferase involved in cell wall biosynthesis